MNQKDMYNKHYKVPMLKPMANSTRTGQGFTRWYAAYVIRRIRTIIDGYLAKTTFVFQPKNNIHSVVNQSTKIVVNSVSMSAFVSKCSLNTVIQLYFGVYLAVSQ